jgi:peroxiredoxin
MKPIRATSRSIDAVRDFELADQAGRAFRLADALAEGAVLLVFYRGDF